jgi:hypothetical protein
MTLQTSNLRRAVKGVVASGAMAAGLLTGFGAATAFAEPVESCTGEECHKTDPVDPAAEAAAPPVMTADQALAIIAQDYDTGEGGGQLSTLIHDVLKLRALGFKPSNGNREAITKALDYRPNQAPLIDALKETLAYQRRLQAMQQNAVSGQQQPGYGFGIGQPAPGVPPQPGQNSGVILGVG